MAKTFDNISEASATNYLFLFAQRTLALQNEAPTPPPLNALGLPCKAICLPCKAICLLWDWLRTEKQVYSKLEDAPTAKDHTYKASYNRVAVQSEAAKVAEIVAVEFPLFTPISIAERITPLADTITAYIIDHQDDSAQEDRWRTTMKRDMGQSFRKVKEEMQSMDGKLDRIVKELGRLTAV